MCTLDGIMDDLIEPLIISLNTTDNDMIVTNIIPSLYLSLHDTLTYRFMTLDTLFPTKQNPASSINIDKRFMRNQ
ncbi:hypothetical protein NQ317_015968 [Molorchus minor]|uniref:Uncharacterized protein n=1 Tax=Molorchus minor TaxID=1323400 RepID=A0ABQ9JL18_9CUCU|nr:hypothetical protein NQ317_015968 [Molorchus minor]